MSRPLRAASGRFGPRSGGCAAGRGPAGSRPGAGSGQKATGRAAIRRPARSGERATRGGGPESRGGGAHAPRDIRYRAAARRNAARSETTLTVISRTYMERSRCSDGSRSSGGNRASMTSSLSVSRWPASRRGPFTAFPATPRRYGLPCPWPAHSGEAILTRALRGSPPSDSSTRRRRSARRPQPTCKP